MACACCHDREEVLSGSRFPYHRQHVVDQRASCSTCHNPHGSVDNRALIRFGEDFGSSLGVSPSIQSGRLAFESEMEGSGACFLMCHGVDHDPKRYGVDIFQESLSGESFLEPLGSFFGVDDDLQRDGPQKDRPVKEDRREE